MRSLLAAALILCTIPAFAAKQAKSAKDQGGPPDAAQRVQGLKRALKLSNDQSAKVKAIIEEASSEEADLVSQLRDRQRKTHEAIRAILDEEQKEKFDAMRPPRGPMMGGGDEGRRPHPMRPPTERKESGRGDEEDGMQGPPPQNDRDDHPGVMIDTGDAPEKPGAKKRDD